MARKRRPEERANRPARKPRARTGAEAGAMRPSSEPPQRHGRLPVYADPALPAPVRPFPVGGSWIAGFQHHHGVHPKVFAALEVGAPLALVREPGNPYDRFAIALYTAEGARLGYVPRGCNGPLACMIDGGLSLRAAIGEIDAEAPTWRRVGVVLWLELPVAVGPSEN